MEHRSRDYRIIPGEGGDATRLGATAQAAAALAQSEPEVREPSDEEIMELMPSQMHEDLATAVRAMAEQEGIDNTLAKGVMRIMLNRHCVDLARAAIAADRARRPAPAPAGMIPVEYWDMDSGARIVSEPSEERPGGCWLVLNSHHISPLIEFSTAEAAWNALQAARALPLPYKEVK